MKNSLITCAFSVMVLSAYCQSPQLVKLRNVTDSIKTKYLDELAWKTPILRQAGISTDVFAPGTITSDLYGHAFFKARYQTVRTNAYFTVPIVHVGKNVFSSSFAVSHQTMKLDQVTNYEANLPVATTYIHNTLVSTSLSYTRVDSLFHHPIVISLSASGLIDPQSSQYRLTFVGVLTMPIIHTKNSNLSLGLMLLRDPSLPIPVIPFISYYHKFKSPGLEFFLDPSRIVLRKELNLRNSISLANNIGGNLALFNRDITNLPLHHAYSTLEMKQG